MMIARKATPGRAWVYPAPIGFYSVVAGILCLVLLANIGRNVDIGRMLQMSGDAILAAAGVQNDSQVARGIGKVAGSLFPIQLEERTETRRIENFDPSRLPWLARVEVVNVETARLDPETLQTTSVSEPTTYLVQPYGYLVHIAGKLVETLEIAFWGTVVAILISLPLAVLSARNFTPHRVVYGLARAVVSLLRAVPELISALFLVLAYGFGPIAGVLALALHSAGFLGKFYAEDIENANPKPQEALTATGAGRLKVLRYAVLPEVWPQYIAYTFYVLDRNTRMATVIGIVGAGGIGQELMGRFDMFHYHHVGTILVAIFCMVFVLDQLSAQLRKKYL